jgi:hypothetical protein
MFRWIKPESDRAAAAMVVARVCCKGMSIDRAIDETLIGSLCENPNMMSDDARQRFRTLVEEKLNNSIKRRQEYENTGIA